MRRALSSQRRHLAVWFPFLPTDRLRRTPSAEPAPPDRPLVLTDKDRGALRLTAADAQALALGLSPGMTLADARARVPNLDVRSHDVDADARLLKAVLADFDRFTPMAALDHPHGLMLDVTGCAHLFGGEAGLMQAVRSRAERVGLQTRLAMARTPQTARALSRFGPGGIAPQGRDADLARRLPIAAMELPSRDHQALRRAGLKTLGDLDDRPRAPLAARFGADFPDRLDRLMGRVDVRITPHRPPPPVIADRIVAEPIAETDAVHAVIADLLTDVEHQLETRGQGARRFILALYRLDGDIRRIALQTARPLRDPAALRRLFRERLAALSRPIDPGFGFDQLRLSADQLRGLSPEQAAFDRRPDASAALDALIDQLSARLGPEAVLRIEPFASHLPERAWRRVPAQTAAVSAPWPRHDADAAPLRPLHLFDRPQPVEAIALAPDSPPARFTWRRATHRVVYAEGPERIAAEWWRAPRHRVRDYYRVEDEEGLRFWLFRAGEYGADPPPRWYVHGLFA
ncbi:DNA polymerase Y family protein [Brevundimonas sp.]|uniref:Y-family DNA polymerase n=1 Tax=Brevundimonas sp. TaxID=1871086 RepID=UPI0025BEF5A8|nr:DNA polymerase Y family protein [Brevundimonas sp.]